MVEHCPNCGAATVALKRFFLGKESRQKIPEGFEHFKCPKCGELNFTMDQADAIFFFVNAKKAS